MAHLPASIQMASQREPAVKGGDNVQCRSDCNNSLINTDRIMSSHEFHYPECMRGDFHNGEVLNLVCLEPKCIQQSIICGICYDQAHRNHKIRPLKLIISNSQKYLDSLTPLHLDVNKLKQSIRSAKDSMIASYTSLSTFLQSSIADIQANVEALFIKVEEQLDLKAGSTDQLLATLNEMKNHELEYNTFVTLMQKLLAGVPLDPENQETDMSANEVEQSVRVLEEKLRKDLKAKEERIREEIESLKASLQGMATGHNLFESKKEFRFSSDLKHSGISVVSDTQIKSSEGYSYRFALMEPALQVGGAKAVKVGFKVKENHSNWLAVGVCYKNTVASSDYNFNYSTLGHGAYLVSSNAGSWSSIDASKNNQVSAFNYYVNDIVTVEYDPVESKVTFRRKGTEDVHTLEVESKDNDQLHLCGLFYYNNDELEYLGYDEE